MSAPIMIKEALALNNSLLSVSDVMCIKRIVAYVDNQAAVYVWENQYSKNYDLAAIMKDIFQIMMKNNCSLTLVYVPSSENQADLPSRILSKSDTTISKRTWVYLEYLFGKHDVDMFALESNAMVDYNGVTLEHFTPRSSPFSAGIDAFSQCYVDEKNYHAFPPYCLIPAVISFVIEEKINCTLIFPQFVPIPSWFPVVLRCAHIVTVGFLGDRRVLLFPSRKGYQVDKRGLQFNMLAASFSFSEERKKSYDPDRLMSIKPEYFSPVPLIGDSMVRFFEGFRSEISVISLGGVRIDDVFDILKNELDRLSTFVVIIHIGTNDVS